MRRLIKVLLVMLVIAASVTVSYASTIENGGELELQYIGVSNHTESLVKGLGMKAIFSTTIVPK